MAVLDIRKYPDSVLKRRAQTVDAVDDAVRRLIDDMVETMYAAPGVGLAAPQVGVSMRVIVIDVSTKDRSIPLVALINPVIKETEGSVDSEEGCLSLPDFRTTIKRAVSITVEGLNKHGKKITVKGEGLLAVALQHEIDHLEGTLILDRAGFLKREFYRKRLKKGATPPRVKDASI